MLNISNFLNNKISSTSVEDAIPSIRAVLFKNYIKTVIEDVSSQENPKGFRMMFIGNRFKSDFNNPITEECNGSIYYYNSLDNTFKPLVVPTPLFNSQKLVKNSIANLYKEGKYDVYPVMDGTILNLYYFNDSWRISTNKAYDATNLQFCDNKTYGQILEELTCYSHNREVLNTNSLDINKCYTVCIKYNKFHFFNEGKQEPVNNKITIIRYVDLLSGEITWNPSLGISKSNECIPWKQLNNNIQNSIAKHKKLGNQLSYKPFLGVILRVNTGNNSYGMEYNNILLESNLMTNIRNFIYNFTFSKGLKYYDSLALNSTNNLVDNGYYNLIEVNKMNVFLQRKNNLLFLSLFPQFKEDFNKYNHFVMFLTKIVMKNYNYLMKSLFIEKLSQPDIVLNSVPEEENTYNFEYNDKLKNLVIIITTSIKEKKLNILSQEGWDILYDFLMNAKYVDYYYSYLFKS
jgi:hypothetical protein